jgi:hypothetical protein
MLDRTLVSIVVAMATLAGGLAFVVVAIGAAIRRFRGHAIGTAWTAGLIWTAGLALGSMLSVGSDLLVRLPILAAAVVLVVTRFRSGHRGQAGWLLASTAAPWTILWGVFVIALVRGEPFDPGATWAGFIIGAAPLSIGVVLTALGDRPSESRVATPVDASPGSVPPLQAGRSFGAMSDAVRAATRIGPFDIPFVAALVALVASLVIVPLLVVLALPAAGSLAGSLVGAVVGSIVATEAYIRVRPATARQAYEALSWVGESELARFHALFGGRIPITRTGADRWLDTHGGSAPPDGRSMQIEILLLAGRVDAAREAAAGMPRDTPVQRFEQAASIDLVDWMAGGSGDLPAMEAAVAEIQPGDGDDRLRAEVTLATARVRRRIAEASARRATAGAVAGAAPGAAGASTPEPRADSPDWVIEPLIDARRRLGSRADGQLVRALRHRILPIFVGTSLVFGLVLVVLGGGDTFGL